MQIGFTSILNELEVRFFAALNNDFAGETKIIQ